MKAVVRLSHWASNLAVFGLTILLVSCATAPPEPAAQSREDALTAAARASQAAQAATEYHPPAPLAPGWTAGTATVQLLRGDASIALGGGAWQPLRQGQPVNEGDRVRTGAGAVCELFLKYNGPLVRLEPDTTLAIERMRFKDSESGMVIETVLGVENGRVLGNVRPLGRGSAYQVRTRRGLWQVPNGGNFDANAEAQLLLMPGRDDLTPSRGLDSNWWRRSF
jgi:hypothetical protein